MSFSNNQFRTVLSRFVPWWLSDRPQPGKSNGFKFLWSIALILDIMMQWSVDGLEAQLPGIGTATALPKIGAARGILRGQADTDAAYSAKLRQWYEKWANAGTQRQLAIEIHEYLANAPMVRIVNRAGMMTTVATDGSVTREQTAWDWDSVSNPERIDDWWDQWIVVYPTQWALAPTYGSGRKFGDSGRGLGHDCNRVEADAIRGLVAQWSAAHTHTRAIIFTSDATLFDPSNPSSLPDGNWGQWSNRGSGSRVASSRNLATCRYWEL